jgi:ERCC4-type nuclease
MLLGAAANTLTRRAGGRALRAQPKRVVVDVREFMSSLPSVLHQQVRGRGGVCVCGRVSQAGAVVPAVAGVVGWVGRG